MEVAVVDTDVFSFWQRGDTRGNLYRTALAKTVVIVSFQTVAEVLRWTFQRNWSETRRSGIETALQEVPVVEYSFELARHWAAIMAETSRAGFSMGVADAWVAATARMLDLPIATHNRRHFERVAGVSVITFAPA